MEGRWGESRANGSNSLTCPLRKPTQGNILLITQSKPTTNSYPPHMERHRIISKTLVSDIFHKEKSPFSRDLGSRQLLYKHQTSTFLRYAETL